MAFAGVRIHLHGHVNNTTYWQAIEHVLRGAGPDPGRPLSARIDFREPLDLEDELELGVAADENRVDVGFLVEDRIKAVAAADSPRD